MDNIYKPRIADRLLARKLAGKGAVLIDVYPQGVASISVVSAIRHRFTVYHTIRHKPLHNIPLMQGFLQLSVILQRQTDKV